MSDNAGVMDRRLFMQYYILLIIFTFSELGGGGLYKDEDEERG